MNQPIPGNPPETPSNPLIFPNVPEFTPYYSPRDMLELGVFSGTIFNRISLTKGISPKLLLSLPWQRYSSNPSRPEINACYVDAPQRRRDFMDMPERIRQMDTGGWFQWYSKYFYGSRSQADKYRIRQWQTEVLAVYFGYVKACNAVDSLYPVGTWTPGVDTQPPEAVRVWIQQLLQFAWPFNKNPNS